MKDLPDVPPPSYEATSSSSSSLSASASASSSADLHPCIVFKDYDTICFIDFPAWVEREVRAEILPIWQKGLQEHKGSSVPGDEAWQYKLNGFPWVTGQADLHDRALPFILSLLTFLAAKGWTLHHGVPLRSTLVFQGRRETASKDKMFMGLLCGGALGDKLWLVFDAREGKLEADRGGKVADELFMRATQAWTKGIQSTELSPPHKTGLHSYRTRTVKLRGKPFDDDPSEQSLNGAARLLGAVVSTLAEGGWELKAEGGSYGWMIFVKDQSYPRWRQSP